MSELSRKTGLARCLFYRWRSKGKVTAVTQRRAAAICRRLGTRLHRLDEVEGPRRGRPKTYIELAAATIRLEKSVGVTRGLETRFLFELYCMLQKEGHAPSISLSEKAPSENHVELQVRSMPLKIYLQGRSKQFCRQLTAIDQRDNSTIFQMDITGDVGSAFLLAIKNLTSSLENYRRRARQDDERVARDIRQTRI